MRNAVLILVIAMVCVAQEKRAAPSPGLKSVAIRCANMDKMLAFYTEALGGKFQPVDVGGGMTCQFGRVFDVLIKLVPLREKADFENFPVHQLGFAVTDIEKVIATAVKHGGKRMGRNAIRDPDGNTIELYQGAKPVVGERFAVVFTPIPGPKGNDLMKAHDAFIKGLRRRGAFVGDGGRLLVLMAKDEAEVKKVLAHDPAVKHQVVKVKLHRLRELD